jgi:hypothetical protein
MGQGDRATFEQTLAPDAVAVSMGFSKTSGARASTDAGDSGDVKAVLAEGLRPSYRSFIADSEQEAAKFELSSA